MQTEDISPSPPAIATLVDVKPDGIYLVAYCPVCDKSETAKIDYPGQPRLDVASVAKIRAHLEKRHRRKRPGLLNQK